MQERDNNLSHQDQLKIFNAVRESDIDTINQLVLQTDLIDSHFDFFKDPSIPSILYYSPPIISVAAYLGSQTVVEYLLMNKASITQTDHIFFLLFL